METEQNGRTFDLNMDKWRELSKSGVDIPIHFCVQGDSMRPLIRRNRDLVTVVPLRAAPEIGDIVLFYRPGAGINYVLHRVWKVQGDMVRTFGDGCYHPDPWMPSKNVWGIATHIKRGFFDIDPNSRSSRAWAKGWTALVRYRKWLFLPRRMFGRVKRIAARILKSAGWHRGGNPNGA